MKSQLKNKTSYKHSLCEMNDKTYELRSKVINIIREANSKGFNLPRIEVRIVTGGKENNCGYAYLKKNIIHIHDKYVNDSRLKHIVLHEVVHAVTGFEHDNKCPLMHPKVTSNIDETILWNTFEKYVPKSKFI